MKFQPTVADFYSSIADRYDVDFEEKADNREPGLLLSAFALKKFEGGSILDLGCGTGKLIHYLSGQFAMIGIGASWKMTIKASARGYREVILGPVEKVLSLRPTKSVDHVVALSSLYFVENIDLVVWESMRIARKSIFVTLEQFDEETSMEMAGFGIKLFNHSREKFGDTEYIDHVNLWTRPSNGKVITGSVVHKIL